MDVMNPMGYYHLIFIVDIVFSYILCIFPKFSLR